MTRGRLVVGNWKMNPATVTDAIALARTVAATPHAGADVGIAPPAIALAAIADAVRGSDLGVYAQDAHWEDKGAYTGQISVSMLRGIARGAIVGHSEVRRDQCDDDARVALKAWRVLKAGLRPIICVGESESEREQGATNDVLFRQITAVWKRLSADDDPTLPDRAVIAYEPIWAIGTGKAASANDATNAATEIRRAMADIGGYDGSRIPILYGGSVTAANAAAFAAAAGIDGALVGGASLKADEIAAIIAAFAE
jgi:triosephosphate isomerase